jgi:hypothetical protein
MFLVNRSSISNGIGPEFLGVFFSFDQALEFAKTVKGFDSLSILYIPVSHPGVRIMVVGNVYGRGEFFHWVPDHNVVSLVRSLEPNIFVDFAISVLKGDPVACDAVRDILRI